MNYKSDCINIKMVGDTTAMLDITAAMVEIIKVGRSLVPLSRFIVSSVFSCFQIDIIIIPNLVLSLDSK